MSKKPVGGNKPAGVKQSDPVGGVAPDLTEALSSLGELPRSYGTDTIFLVAQEPHWLFTYWDIDISLHPGGKTFLRVITGADSVESEIEVPFETRNWYIPVGKAGETYTVEIGYYRGTAWNVLARSISVSTPPDKMSDSEQFDYATIPLHLSFQKLMENIHTTLHDGETLIQALARLQKEGRLLPMPSTQNTPASPDERIVLEALLGKEALEELTSSSLSSEELSSRIHQRLEERLGAGGSSEFLTRAEWGPAESSLFSALSAITGGASWTNAALSSWAAAALTSWAVAAQSSWNTGAGSSWNAGATSSWGAESLTSWLKAAASSWSGGAESSSQAAALSSWLQGATSSWSAAAVSSWLQAAQSSWAGAAMSSWSQAALSSWSQAAMTSWSHGATSSWGGSETVNSFSSLPREFFLHVNAEVIFYGGTHPNAKVTIAGKPVQLNPDGTFRHHFIFPDGNYEIPITATSPDGVETRSATLTFDRSTVRTGDVGHTAQPPFSPPLGAK